MKKTVIVYGLIAGLIVSSIMVISMAFCYQSDKMEGSMLLGFASMILAFSLVFVGIKNYRDKYNGGAITFWRAFLTGLYITLIASTVYVVVWMIDYYFFIPDFMEKYAAYVLKEASESGLSQIELDKKAAEMATYSELYRNPIGVALLTYLEILPVGILANLISALILRKKAASTI